MYSQIDKNSSFKLFLIIIGANQKLGTSIIYSDSRILTVAKRRVIDSKCFITHLPAEY